MNGALEGIRVLDFTRLLPGPFCTMVLADHGAEVIKIEAPGIGDYIRKMGPMSGGESVFYDQLNRNKKSITLNLKSEEGKEICKKMVLEADVLVESFRPDVMNQLGLGYSGLSELNPGLIYCSITGYGQTGPYRYRAGHDLNYVGLAGLLSLSAIGDECPIIPSIQVADVAGGSLWGTISILLALMARQRTGRGQFLDVSMLEGTIAFQPLVFSELLETGYVPSRNRGLLSGYLASYNLYPTLDGKYMSIGILEEKFWKNFCEKVDRPEWISQQYAPPDVQEAMKKQLTELFQEKTRDQWVEFFANTNDCCVEPVLEPGEVIGFTQVSERNFIEDSEHPRRGKARQLNSPCRLSATPARFRRNAPLLGEHTEEFLLALGYSERQIQTFKETGVY